MRFNKNKLGDTPVNRVLQPWRQIASSIILCLLTSFASAGALPEGFEGLAWEAPLAQMKSPQKLAETPLYECYRSGDGTTRGGNTGVSILRHCFAIDRFYFVQMEFVGESAHTALLAHLQSLWGEARAAQRFTETHTWGGAGASVYVELEYSKGDDRGTLAYVYLPIYRETQEANRQERARSRPGAGF